MIKRYNPSEIEPKWQQIWHDDARYRASSVSDLPKYYISCMFPYPSGAGMHVGHAFEHAIVDTLARFERAQGKNVLNPMGWDSFGLPAENYAIKTGIAPSVVTKQNIANFTKQLQRMGASIDWSRELNTSSPEYYRWTQWVFTQFYQRGLAYQKHANQWWCDSCQTVLANEQVINSACWRCDGLVKKKPMKQWFFKITDYADALLENTPSLEWPEKIKTAQTNWIGKSVGAEVDFSIVPENPPRYVLLHGFGGRADKNWLPWMKEKLEAQGAIVEAPQLPNTDEPKEIEQVAYALEQCTFDENTTIVAHSLGGVVAMKVLEKITSPINKLVLVAPVIEPAFRDENYEFKNPAKPRNFVHTFDCSYDYDEIKRKVSDICVLSDTVEDDRRPYLEYLADQLDADFYETTAARVHFTANEEPFILDKTLKKISAFTTRPDTLFGVTFLVLAPEYPTLENIVSDEQREKVRAYCNQALKRTDVDRMSDGKQKTGVFTGAYATNPATGQKIPIWVADYVLGGYGTGAIMAVPAHDERDNAFAKAFDLPIVPVVEGKSDDDLITGEGRVINSGQFDSLDSSDARQKIIAWLSEQGMGEKKTTYKMRDWLISRQRYWGAPIPIVHVEGRAPIAVAESCLPVELPHVEDYAPKGNGSVLETLDDWVRVWVNVDTGETVSISEEKPAGDAWVEGRRETDTMDGYACSSWYLLRYTSPGNEAAAWDTEQANYWMPVDTYVGGDHAVAHLLYVRFWSHVFADMGLIENAEPVKDLVYHGLIQAEDGTKMSKSKGNVVDPLEVIDQGYGADALRTFLLFLGPITDNSAWSSTGIAGVYRFLNRVWTLVQEYCEADAQSGDEDAELRRLQHAVTKKVTEDIKRHSFNTAIAGLMEYVNDLYKHKTKTGYTAAWSEPLAVLVQLLAPLAPHMSAELWRDLGNDTPLDTAPFPTYNDSYLVADTITLAVQVNGKVRGEITVDAAIDTEELKHIAMTETNVAKHINGLEPRKIIVVPKKLVNIVV